MQTSVSDPPAPETPSSDVDHLRFHRPQHREALAVANAQRMADAAETQREYCDCWSTTPGSLKQRSN